MKQAPIVSAFGAVCLLLAGCFQAKDNTIIPQDIPDIQDQNTQTFPFQDIAASGPLSPASVSLGTVENNKVVGCFGGLDCIPQYSYPPVVGADQAGYVDDNDLVLGVVINGVARAYPLSTFWHHEIANDTVGGIRVTVNYCPLTGTGLNFKGTLDGKPVTFGVSGFLYNNNLIMYDHQTQSFWPQMLFTAAWGERKGQQAQLLPVYDMTWAAWKALHPQTTVVSGQLSSTSYPYSDYRTNHNNILFNQQFDSRLDNKDVVMGVIGKQTARAYPFKNLGERAVINDLLDGEPILVVFDKAARAAAVYRRPLLTNGDAVIFNEEASPGAFPFNLTAGNAEGSWNFLGTGIDGQAVDKDLVAVTTAFKGFWMAWSAYYRGIEIYGN
ncbi:MAG: DUF3179 domain-containing protein [Chitinivibrionales bacterium]|nr:DUF3179 domain-containing protein [Chitinivibrionales bacterium]